jgi:DNA-binding SARP family transcriptional activator/TolB-like protein
MRFVLQLFGGARLDTPGGEPIPLTERKMALLAYLALAPGPVPRPVAAELLGDVGSEQEQRAALRQALYLIRKSTHDQAILSDRKSDLSLNVELVQADVRLFQKAMTEHGPTALEAAVELYRGPFLEGFKSPSAAFENWLQSRRTELLEDVIAAVLALSDQAAAKSDHANALAYARRVLTFDELREDAHRRVMTCLAALGQRTKALRHYKLTRKLLAEELGVLPEAATTALHDAIARGDVHVERGENSPPPRLKAIEERLVRWGLPAVLHGAEFSRSNVLAAIALVIVGGSLAWYERPAEPPDATPSIAVLPFTSNIKDAAGEAISVEQDLSSLLSAHPGLRVVSLGQVSAEDLDRQWTKARYALHGFVRPASNKLQVTVQLIDAERGDQVWADLLEAEGNDIGALEQQIAYRIYESLVGFTGQIERNEQRAAWSKSDLALSEYDVVRRGEQLALLFQKEPQQRAHAIWMAGLVRFPNSVRLRINLALLYRYWAEVGWSANPDEDLARAWQLGREASQMPYTSRYDQWLSHWLMAKLYQWCKQDFESSVGEARNAAKLLPYDATTHADLAELMANAGYTDVAIEWLKESIRRDPAGPEWYRGNLAWAYYLSGRYQEALAELKSIAKPKALQLAAVYVKLGRVDEARSLVAKFLEKKPDYAIHDAARWPLIGPQKRGWLEDLRIAGLPD